MQGLFMMGNRDDEEVEDEKVDHVDNNYVNYSGMCWKIIRVQGDGTVKMILVSEDKCQSSDLKTGPVIGAYTGVKYSEIIDEQAAFYEKSNVPNILNTLQDIGDGAICGVGDAFENIGSLLRGLF